MKRYLSVLLLLLCWTMSALSQTKADTLISEHRQWMKKYYPKAESLSEEQLLREAAFAVYDHLQEPEAIALLHAVGRQVPAVESYASLTEQRMADTKYRHSIQALEALYRYAVSHLGENNPTTGWCKFLWLYLSGDMQNVEPQFTDAAIVQQRIADKTDNKENEALACLFKLGIFFASEWEDFICSPLQYDDVLKTEKNISTLCSSDSISLHTKAWLYTLLGYAKRNFTQPLETKYAYKRANIQIDETYVYDFQKGIADNSAHYFRLAEGLYQQLFSTGHPETMKLYISWKKRHTESIVWGDNDLDMLSIFSDYAHKYYGNDSLALLQCSLELYEAQDNSGLKVEIKEGYKQLLDKFKELLGEDNYFLVVAVRRLAKLAAFHNPQEFDFIQKTYNDLVSMQMGKDNVNAAYHLFLLYAGLKDVMSKEEHDYKIICTYSPLCVTHKSTYPGILLARHLSDYYNNIARNELSAFLCKANATSDVRKIYGLSPIYYEECAQQYLSSSEYKSSRDLMKTIVEEMRYQNLDRTDILALFAQMEANHNKNKRAAELFQQAFEESASEGKTQRRAYFLLQKLYALRNENVSQEEGDKIFAMAKDILDHSVDTIVAIPENYYIAAAWYEGNITRDDKAALEMLNKGISICERQNHGFSKIYIDLITERNAFYYYILNDKKTAYRLMNEDFVKFQQQNLKFYTIDMLHYMCKIFNYYDQRYDDLNTWFNYYGLITVMINNIGKQRGNDIKFICEFNSYHISKTINIAIYFSSIKKNTNWNLLDSEERQEKERLFATIDKFIKNITNVSLLDKLIGKIRKELPNYQLYDGYETLLNTAFSFYTYLCPDYKKAKNYLDEAIHIANRKNDNAKYINKIIDLGDLYRVQSLWEKAKKTYIQALQELNKGKHSQEQLLAIYNRLALVSYKENNNDDMLKYSRLDYNTTKKIFDNNFSLLPQQEQNYMLSIYGDPAYWLILCLENKQDIAKEVYDAVLYRTGLQLRSQQGLHQAILKSNDKNLISLLEKLTNLRTEQKKDENLMSTHIIDMTELTSLADKMFYTGRRQESINVLERDIITRVSPYLKQEAKDISWTQIRDRLQPSEAAIEFIIAEKNIMALVVKPGCETPTPVTLTNIDTLKAAILSLNTKSPAATARKLYNNPSINLYGMLWQPLEKELKGVSKVYYATQGMLYSIAFAAISTPDGKYLCDSYDLCPLTSTAEIVKEQKEQLPQSVVAMGNIYYTDKQRQQVAAGDINGARGGEEDVSIDDFSDRGAKRYHFKYLPFTKKEIEDLSSIIKNRQLTLEEGTEATEQNLRNLLDKKPDVIHLATHGFFIAKSDEARKVPFFQHYSQAIENSMQRAGIALAGAEDTWTGVQQPEEANDGILTANEVAQMDLNGTQLVTLSACETALGDYSFEGVFGLPRGFKQAGVKSLLVSLWSVNDKSTSLLMSSFYRYWMQGETKQQALKHAVNDVRKDYPEPFYWAPFVLLDATE